MQPKTEVQFAIGVTEIVKTFISHPDHGLGAEDVPVMIKNIMKAFQEASLTSGETITAAITATETVQSTEETAASTEAPAAAAIEAAPPEAPRAAKRGRSREAAPVDAPAEAVAAEVVAEVPAEKPAPKKKPAPVDPLEAKFGGKIPRTRWNNMDPEEAIKNDEIVCLIDGVGRKMLHRWLKSRHNMTPEEYREWFTLREDYPMTAPGYSKEKSEYAKVVGLGTTAFTEKTKATPKTSRRTRKASGQGTGARQRTTA